MILTASNNLCNILYYIVILQTIQNNLKAGKGNTTQVYKLVFKSKNIAVFGVGLKSKEDGEAHFLPKIGEAHAAALPYEIILQGNKATMQLGYTGAVAQ